MNTFIIVIRIPPKIAQYPTSINTTNTIITTWDLEMTCTSNSFLQKLSIVDLTSLISTAHTILETKIALAARAQSSSSSAVKKAVSSRSDGIEEVAFQMESGAIGQL